MHSRILLAGAIAGRATDACAQKSFAYARLLTFSGDREAIARGIDVLAGERATAGARLLTRALPRVSQCSWTEGTAPGHASSGLPSGTLAAMICIRGHIRVCIREMGRRYYFLGELRLARVNLERLIKSEPKNEQAVTFHSLVRKRVRAGACGAVGRSRLMSIDFV